MSNQVKNLAIGIFVFAALSIIVYILLFLHPTVSDKGQILKVRFTNIDKISIGTRVLFAGHPVGEVTNIEEVEDARTQEKTADGQVYIYQLTLAIDSGVIIYTTDTITPTTSGLLGEKAISIIPQPPKKDKALIRVTDQILFAEPPSSVEDALKQVTAVVTQINKGLETLDEGKFWDNVSQTAENIADITTAMNRPDEITEIFDNFKGSTVGKLVTTDDLYLRMTSLFSKGETVMDDINHYGLLFNNNKNWQRLRARRINLVTELSTPREFTNYFNDEINEISTSIARVSEVLRASCFCTVWENACSESFEEVFAELLRRIDGLEQMTKLINQQIVDERDRCKTPCR